MSKLLKKITQKTIRANRSNTMQSRQFQEYIISGEPQVARQIKEGKMKGLYINIKIYLIVIYFSQIGLNVQQVYTEYCIIFYQ